MTVGTKPLSDPVINEDALHLLVEAPVIVDVRWYLDGRSGVDAYREGHIAGALFVDLDTVLAGHGPATAGRHPLPTPESFATALGDAGVPENRFVVAYDDSGGGTAARLVWMLRGIRQPAAILDGGLRNWHYPLTREETPVHPVMRAAHAWPASFLTELESLEHIAMGDVVLDARATERYRGEVEPVDPRAGHIPIAKSLPWTTLCGNEGTLLPRAQVAERFSTLGIDSADQLVASCGSGVTACMLLVAAEYAGLGRGRLFVPSFSGWSSDEDRAVATGE